MAGVALGTSVWSFMTGVAMVKSGMSVAESVLMALLVYAGSAQLAALPLIAAAAPLWVIWLTALCVNLRFVVFSLHLRAYLIHLPLLRRLPRPPAKRRRPKRAWPPGSCACAKRRAWPCTPCSRTACARC